ncbi:hypothetical protein K402DRAFT_140073 [Aulographum hederae CBS 113979]|uniref:Uncharacterized protein n=1 Tax=Aulographum hederae CBS 113979 TaxID=1176131 RepID=A0A6G1GV40_9PEZI|nr:hypothetical protein K402DRAFT_140073 [Aulographum hederae CBS 113979]
MSLLISFPVENEPRRGKRRERRTRRQYTHKFQKRRMSNHRVDRFVSIQIIYAMAHLPTIPSHATPGTICRIVPYRKRPFQPPCTPEKRLHRVPPAAYPARNPQTTWRGEREKRRGGINPEKTNPESKQIKNYKGPASHPASHPLQKRGIPNAFPRNRAVSPLFSHQMVSCTGIPDIIMFHACPRYPRTCAMSDSTKSIVH